MIKKLQTWEQAKVTFSFDRTLNIFLESVKKELKPLTDDSENEIGSRIVESLLAEFKQGWNAQRKVQLIQTLGYSNEGH